MKNSIWIILICVFCESFSQTIKVSNIVSENKITSFSEQKLILIDFWATWCAPCVYATQQLEILQLHNKDKVFIISISDEHESKIKTYLERKPIDLMVISDYENYTFKKHGVQSRPYAVLLDLKGNLLWKGSPSDLTQRKLDEYYKNQPKNSKMKDLFSIIELREEESFVKEKLIDSSTILIESITESFEEISSSDNEVIYSGSLSNLFFVLSNKYPFELDFEIENEEYLKMTCSKEMWENNKETIINEIMVAYNLQKTDFEKEINVTELMVRNDNLLWDVNQFDWEGSLSNYIVGTDRIQADNMTLTSLCGLLSKVKEVNYIYKGNNKTLYDWDLQFLYDDLMKEELESSFGIVLKPTIYKATITKISKK